MRKFKTKRKLKRSVVNAIASVTLTFIVAFICVLITPRPDAKEVEEPAPVVEIIEEKIEKLEVKEPEIIEEVEEVEPAYMNYRLTSFYSGDECGTGSCTGSGLCEKDFDTNEHGWYTYEGKLVLAAATTYLQKDFGYKEGRHYFKYYEEVDLIIDGIEYRGIILDSCGASMTVKEDRLDLFVNGKNSVIDRGYLGVNPIQVSY